MKDIKVLGGGCANCDTVMKMIETKSRELGSDITLEKISDMAVILGFGVMSTPGVVVDGKVVHSGSVPSPSMVEGWLKG